MDKEALLNTILKDLGEISTMVKAFQGQQDIPAAFLDLTESKLNQVAEEFKLLKNLNGEVAPIKTATKIEEVKSELSSVATPPTTEEKVAPPIDESNVKESIEKVEVIAEKTPENEVEVVQKTLLESSPTPKPEVKTIIPKEEKIEEGAKTVGESYGGEKKSVNDIIANTKEGNSKKILKGKPVSDLTKGLGINDRFMFQRELFNGKPEVLNQTLLQLNDMPDFISAQSFIKSNFNWDEEQEATKAFFNYVERKF